ncbi:cell growth-regulating nucleolar protein [Anopheles maculipalpis]|uniref:cell growth-regulating nucleolar protein n=1 Tax=Anopheles maculipalpis TaxID=1496333 RepID=UPI002158C176|nr:cell growth-regulating nucleolar protein [Anopheles maculipalpis]
MVFFICNHCGESLKKQVVSAHAYRCRRPISVSCMDCLKDFHGQAYDAHTVCISEAEKYAAKGFVAKEKKGAKKQESWVSMVRSITERNSNLSPGVKSVFEIINRTDNIPRKCKPFVNYFQNSFRYLNRKDVEQAWAIIEREVKSEHQTTAQQNAGAAQESAVPTKNGTDDPKTNGVSAQNDVAEKESSLTKQKKRKTEHPSENGHGQVEQQSSKQKKRKTKDTSLNGHEDEAALLANGTDTTMTDQHQDQTGDQEKFHWSDVIRGLLLSKNNQMKLSKLKKKVLKRYQQTTGSSETDDGKFEKKFQKKIAKNSCFVVENDTVRLVEA